MDSKAVDQEALEIIDALVVRFSKSLDLDVLDSMMVPAVANAMLFLADNRLYEIICHEDSDVVARRIPRNQMAKKAK